MRSSTKVFAAVVVVLAALVSALLIACSEGESSLIAVNSVFPASAIKNPAELGIVQPTFARKYLVTAYRQFAHPQLAPVNTSEAAKTDPHEAVLERWLEAKESVLRTGAGIRPYDVGTWRSVNYQNYVNCGDDAFVTATRTLRERIATFGITSPAVAGWLAAQDVVFSNCDGREGSPAKVPAAVPAQSPLAADRAYQTAAAYFYAGDLDRAEALFREIGVDRASPWQTTARLVAARCMIRRATLTAQTPEASQSAMARAEEELASIMDDASLASVHSAARQLQGFVSARAHPARRIRELSAILEASVNPSAQDVVDYTWLLNGRLGDTVSYAFNTVPEREALVADDPMTDWIVTFQGSGAEATSRAISRWRATHSLPWLVAVLTKAPAEDPVMPEALAEAATVPATSKAFHTLLFLRIRQLTWRGERDQARALLPLAPSREQPGAPMEAVNFFRAEAMMLARSLDDFLAAAPRSPVMSGWSLGLTDDPMGSDFTKPALDRDAVDAFNNRMPLAILAAAAQSEILPPRLRRFVAAEGLSRAIILQNDELTSQLAGLLGRLSPEVAGDLAPVSNAPTAHDRHNAGVLFLLRHPLVSARMPNETYGTYQDLGLQGETSHIGSNWWCAFDPGASERAASDTDNFSPLVSTVISAVYGGRVMFPEFISAADRRALAAEWAALSQSNVAPTYLADEAVAWAKASPRDERAAEALARAVEGTRWGCRAEGTAGNGPASQRAFQTLHRLFPNSPWAKKTKYWYRGNE